MLGWSVSWEKLAYEVSERIEAFRVARSLCFSFLILKQVRRSKLEVAAAGWKAAEVGETQLPEASGRVDCEGTPSIRNGASGEGLPH